MLSKRFPNLLQNNIGAVGTVIFLRFINPAIVSPQELGIVNKQVPSSVKRGLMLMSKILQNIANHVEFSKEQHMLCFNDFLRAHVEAGRRFFIQIASDCESVDQTTHNMSYISDANVVALHRLLWTHQEKIGKEKKNQRINPEPPSLGLLNLFIIFIKQVITYPVVEIKKPLVDDRSIRWQHYWHTLDHRNTNPLIHSKSIHIS